MMSFEDFELSANIAAACADHSNVTHNTKDSCGWNDGFTILFITGVSSGCEYDGVDGEKICYQVPTEAIGIFGS